MPGLELVKRVLKVLCRIGLLALLALAATLLMASPAQAQIVTCYGRPITTLDFRNPTLISGTALTAGAVYRFSNVAIGVDARVRIDAMAGASLAIIDRDADLIRNFQPELAGGAPGNVDFTITFYVAGTTTPIALDFAASGIDIDGDSGSLREYSEFSSPYAAYVLDSSTRLDVNASGPSVGTNTRFESTTTFTAPGIDPTATQNIVSVLYTATSTFKYRIGSLGSGNTTRLTSLDFSCPALSLPSQTTVVPQDFSDAPAAYGNPVHDILAGFRIGATNTAEQARYNSPNADGDLGDDGVTIPQLRRTFSSTIAVQVSGLGGRLQAWIDFNGNGSFADVGEQIATNIADNGVGDSNPATGIIGLTFTTPAAATLAQTFGRFRWSTATGVGSNGTASNGEVEDYAFTIFGLPTISVVKTSTVYDPTSSNLFAIPGNEVVYAVTTTNSGNGPTDGDSLFVVDRMPSQLEFFTGDYDGPGPVVGSVEFISNGANLTFTPSTDLRYSNAVSAPATFAACTYTPVATYDANVRHLCLNPKGTMPSGTSPAPNFVIRFRARIK